MAFSRLALALALLFLATIQFTSAQSSPKDFVDAHNAVRKRVRVPPVSWDGKLAFYAWNYAKKQTGDCWPVKYSHGPYGENIFWGRGHEYTAWDAVKYWASKKKHYTQMVWAATKKIGCARAKCEGGAYYIICEYYPKANIH